MSGVGRRRRQLRVVLVLAALALGVGMAVWKFRARLSWSPVKPPPGDGIEEIGEQ